MGWVYPIPKGYWVGYGIRFRNFRGYGSDTGLGDTRPDYLKRRTHLPGLYTRSYTLFFFNLYFYFLLTLVY
ncbi:hypothetical protein Hanom_Chr00s087529g01797281 [Helianthus anomalus]